MSLHKSLRSKSSLSHHRNVMTRAERWKILNEEGRRKEEDSVFNLPKVRSILRKRKGKTKTEEGAEGTPATAAAPAAGAAPKAAAKPAAKK